MNERSIFMEALAKEEAERSAYLADACGGDTALLQRVEALLESHEQAGNFLAKPVAERLAEQQAMPAGGEATSGSLTSAASDSRARPGTVIGPYKLLQQIGEGGMGTVFMAEQTEPVQRKVALKLIKSGLDSRQVIARFEAERQALALMDHPNIAKVLDAGTVGKDEGGGMKDEKGDSSFILHPSSFGRPYFVMELVKGVPITKYCDEHHLTPRERLELFVPVCQAVQHAHQKGIIHRDIKPSNVMVCLYDGRPVPKVIDFGVAKAAGPKLTERTLFTELGQVVGTLEYMSPEQAELNQLDVDTRSDIYSLGVLLYELLTGTTPLERGRLKQAAFLEVLRLIREEEPPRPSTRLSTTEELPSIAANRGLEPRKLSGLVRGELDWIVMKALEKDRNRRYETANAFAMDLQRYLADEPVTACPPSAGYRLRKFVRRNRGSVVAASATLFCLVSGIIGTSGGMVWAMRERDEKGTALIAETKERTAKERALAAETEARLAEKQARDRALSALKDMTDDIVENQMARDTQLAEENKEFLRKIIKHFEGFAAVTADNIDSRDIRAEGYFRVGLMRYHLGEFKEAEVAYEQALALRQQLSTDNPTRPWFRHDLSASYHNLGALHHNTGRMKEAEIDYAAARSLRQQLVDQFPAQPESRRDLAGTLANEGYLFSDMGRLKDSEDAYLAGLSIHKQLAAEFPNQPQSRRDLAITQNNLAILLHETGRLKDALDAYAAALSVRKQLADDFPARPEFRYELATTHNNEALLLRDMSRLKEAEAAYAAALALQKQVVAEFPTRPVFRAGLAATYYNLALLLIGIGKTKEAEDAIVTGHALFRRLVADFPLRPDYRQGLASSQTSLGLLLLSDSARQKEGEDDVVAALAIAKKLADDFPNRPEYRSDLAARRYDFGNLLVATGRLNQAEDAYAAALAVAKQLVADVPTRPQYRSQLARIHQSLASIFNNTGRLREAETAYAAALTIEKQLVADFPARPELRQALAATQASLGVLLRDAGRLTEADTALSAALDLQKQMAADFPTMPYVRHDLARTYTNVALLLRYANQPKEAEHAYAAALRLQKELAAKVPDMHGIRQDLARTQNDFAFLLFTTGRLGEAKEGYATALALRKQVVAEFPNNPEARNDLAGTLVNLAILHVEQGDFKAAKACLDEAAPHHESALKSHSRHPTYRRFYWNNLFVLARANAGLGDKAAAKHAAQKLRDLGSNPSADAYDGACCLASCIPVIQNDDRATKEARAKQTAFYADEAMTMLRDAVAKGWKNAAQMKRDKHLEPLHDREDFKKLVAELEARNEKK
jgi:serine/threonine protein kinase/tetratricopeptide (TPR) repeat protein